MHQSAEENEFEDKKKEPEPPPEPGERDGGHSALKGGGDGHDLSETVQDVPDGIAKRNEAEAFKDIDKTIVMKVAADP
eukprot:13495014-Alexandrium_andersonii.AAC.1